VLHPLVGGLGTSASATTPNHQINLSLTSDSHLRRAEISQGKRDASIKAADIAGGLFPYARRWHLGKASE